MSLTNDLYYSLKPILPRWLQIQMRRQVVRRKREKYAHLWPIDEKAGLKPEGWPGWPEGKQFALVLTHDVEKTKGLEKVVQLAEIERKIGFRSCFNFVAEDYHAPRQLLKYLEDGGFEVGLHGLHHKGNLFRSRKAFDAQASRINHRLKDWGAEGFRAPSVFHNLDWIGELDIQYDSSTFDTDPFEPQPDGIGTIFPCWVQDGSRAKGFVELPYTLPQDFTLFVLMKERNIDIWKKKIDWIIEKGGMALLNAHPDYMNCTQGRCTIEDYPVEYYEEFLNYVKTRYDGQYWHVLPREMARFWKERMVIAQSSK